MQLRPPLMRRQGGRGALGLAGACSALLIALIGCGPAAPVIPGPEPDPQHFQLQLSTAQVAVTAGSVVHLSVTVTRAAGFTDPVALSLNGAPAGLTATFTPDTADPDTSDVALQAAASVVPYDYPVFISGTSGIEQEDAAFTTTVQDPVTIDVHGRVVGLFREPVPDATVTIAGVSVTAGADGSFAIPNVAWPYDAIVTVPGGGEVHAYLGVSRANPVLPVLTQAIAPPYGATVSGSLTGSAANGSQEIAEVAFASPEAHGGTVLWGGQGPVFGPFAVVWSGPATTQGSLVGLKWAVGADGLPSRYLGFASTDLALSDQQSATGSDLQLVPVGTSYISGTVNAPSGFSVTSKTLWLTAGPHSGMALGIIGGSDPLFTFATPTAGLPLGVQARADLNGASSILYLANLQPNQVVDLTLPAPPTLDSPLSGTVDHATVFQWTPVADTISVLALTSQTGGTAVYVYTANASAGLPQPPALTLPASTRYQWTVWAWGMYGGMDAFTDPAIGPGSFGLDRDALVAVAQPIGFFTSATP